MNILKCGFFLTLFISSQGCAQEFDSKEKKIIDSDERNKAVHFDLSSHKSVLNYCVQNIEDTGGAMDVFRIFLQAAEVFKDINFESVKLCFRDQTRFVLKGTDFKSLGEEYGQQNPIYTIRTFPEKLQLPDGTPAYPKHTGGLLYLLRVQMDDFNDMNNKWFMEELLAEKQAEIEKQRPEVFATDEEVF